MTKRESEDPADRGEVIRRDSPTPYHRQLTDILEQRILDGVIEEKSRLPSELELADRFGLSRSTVRQALQALVARGYAVRIVNRGHFASTPPQEHGWIDPGPSRLPGEWHRASQPTRHDPGAQRR